MGEPSFHTAVSDSVQVTDIAACSAGADVASVGAAVVAATASVVPGADVSSGAVVSAVVVAGASVGAVVASPPSSSSSPHAAAINERPTAIAAIRLVRLLITWILLIESQREVVLPLAALGAVQFTL